MMRRSAVIPLCGALALLAALPAGAQEEPPPAGELRQSAAVLARFGDVAVALRSPWFAEGRERRFDPSREAAGFTTQAEMEAFLGGLAETPGLALGSIGRSAEGRDIPYALFTADGAGSLRAAAARRDAADAAERRPVVWLIGQHHGNEPAGGEAMLAVIRDLAAGGRLADVVRAVDVVVVPRANPDGTAAFRRTTADGADPNRDHLLMLGAESRALHAAAAILPPDVVVDAHEFTVGGRWLLKFGALHAADFVFMRATHPMVPAGATALAEAVFLPAINAAATAAGLTSYVYQTSPNARADDRTVATGGNAAGIARNAFGLGGAVSILLETRGVGIGAQSMQRRTASHYLAADAVLRAAAGDPRGLVAAVAAARDEAARSREPVVVAHRVPPGPGTVPLLDPDTAAPRIAGVPFLDARRIEPTVVRPRPVGYLLLDAAAPALAALRLRGALVCDLPAGAPVPPGAEAFGVTARAAADRNSINPAGGVAARAEPAGAGTLPPGSRFVPVAQPLAGLVVASLDPDAPGGFAAAGLLPGAPGERLPILRLPAGSAAPAPCGG